MTSESPAPAAPASAADLQGAHVGVLAALPGELGVFRDHSTPASSPFGIDLGEVEMAGQQQRITTVVSGVGKVAAARAALALIAHGVDGLMVVGTCGGLTPGVPVGELVHIRRAIQWDLAVREGRESQACASWTASWQALVPGSEGVALTADRPAIRWWERYRRGRALRRLRLEWGEAPLVPVADMETAAVGAVAESAGVPWAALRVVSDAQRTLTARVLRRDRDASSFAAHYRDQAHRPAAALQRWLAPAE